MIDYHIIFKLTCLILHFVCFLKRIEVPFCQMVLLAGQFGTKYAFFNEGTIALLLIRPRIHYLIPFSAEALFTLRGKTTFSYPHSCVSYCGVIEISLPSIRWEKTLSSAAWKYASGILLTSICPDILIVRASEKRICLWCFWEPLTVLKGSLASCSSSIVVTRNVLNFCKC